MAILNDDEESFKSKEIPTSGGTSFIGPGAMAGGSSTGATSNQAPTKPAQQGSGFQNIMGFLSANQAGGQQMASGLVNDVDKSGQAATGDINSFVSDTEKASSAGTPIYDDKIANQWMAETSPTQAGVNQAQQFGDAPNVSFSKPSPDSSYKGYEGFSNSPLYGKAQQSTQKVADTAKNMGTFSGVQTLLGGKYNQAPTTQMGGKLDAALTKYGTGGQGLTDSSNSWGNITNVLGAGEKKAQGSIDTAKAQAKTVTDQWAQAQQNAAANAANTNNVYGALIQGKKNNDEIGKMDQQRQAQQTAMQKAINDAKRPAQSYQDAATADRRSYIGQLQPGGLKDGWIWNQEDIDRYLRTGSKPTKPKSTSSGTYSTPQGDY